MFFIICKWLFSKIINKPENIKIGADIEFELIETSKGLNAKDIYFIEKIECPICNTENLEIDKNCKNEKCNFDLTYVKDGSFIGLSQNEIEGYNEKLKYFRMNYFNKLHDSSQNIKKNSKEFLKIIKVNNNQKELNKIERGKIIKGKIISYNQMKSFGFILGEDANKYFFHISNTEKPLDIKKNLFVLFVSCKGSKGLFAENITIVENYYDHDDYDDYDDYDDLSSSNESYNNYYNPDNDPEYPAFSGKYRCVDCERKQATHSYMNLSNAVCYDCLLKREERSSIDWRDVYEL